jgi:hypothetical protein
VKRRALIALLLIMFALSMFGCGGPGTVSVGVGVHSPGGWGGYGPHGYGGASVWVGMPPGGYVYY